MVATTSHLLVQADPRALILNTGRNRDQWHTQTRSGKAPQLTNRNPEPLIDIHPVDANKHKISHEEIIIVEGNKQQIQVRCRVTNEVNEGEMFMPIHWSKNNADSGCVSKLIRNIVDPISGQPAFKQTPVTIAKQHYASEALVLVQHELTNDFADYQIKQQIKGGYCYHLASNHAPQVFFEKILTMIAPPNSNYLKRTKRDYYQAGYLNDNEMLAGCFVASKKHLLPMGWAGHFFDTLKFLEIKKDLMFEDVNKVKDKTTFCQCLNVNIGQLREAINAGAISLSKIREKTGAGNGCGSCIDDIIAQLATTNSPVKLQ
jgi:assimilatory nitrate reductase catalytic subunit